MPLRATDFFLLPRGSSDGPVAGVPPDAPPGEAHPDQGYRRDRTWTGPERQNRPALNPAQLAAPAPTTRSVGRRSTPSLAPPLIVLLTVIARDANGMGQHRNGWFDTTSGLIAAAVTGRRGDLLRSP